MCLAPVFKARHRFFRCVISFVRRVGAEKGQREGGGEGGEGKGEKEGAEGSRRFISTESI